MIPVLLTKTKTRDGVTLDGIYVPPKRKSRTALVWLHGLGSRFYSGQPLIQEQSAACQRNGIGYFKCNTRGHDIINRDGAGKNKLQGMAFEKFTACVQDIRASIREAKRIGFRNIILAGQSTGSNKALYYVYKTRDPSVKRLMLTGALSDMAVWKTEEIGTRRIMRRALLVAKNAQKKDALLPEKYGIYSAERYISLYEAGHAEDVFPYHNPRASWKELKSIRIPVAVIIGSLDEYLDRPAKKLIKIFEKNAISAKSFSGIIIKGANHSFRGKEKELAHNIIKWIKTTQ